MLATPVECIRKTHQGFEVNGDRYDRVVSTIPLGECYRRLEGADAEGAAAAKQLQHCGVATFMIGLDAPEETRYSWVYLPHPENGPANRITHLANYSPRNAPEGKSSILAEVTYRESLEIDEKMAWDVVESLHDCGILDARDIEH